MCMEIVGMNTRRPKMTLSEQGRKLYDALQELFITICEALGIDKLVDWLAALLEETP